LSYGSKSATTEALCRRNGKPIDKQFAPKDSYGTMTRERGRPHDGGAAQVFDTLSRSGFAGASKLMRSCAQDGFA
jgi:hypothetical protein